jgi:membrane protein
MVVATGITTLLFACIFKILPDAHIRWRDVMVGAVITAILFMIGRLAIGLYLGRTNLVSLFGAAGSLIVVMLWVYYSSATLYLGAVFTKVYAMNFGGKIRPNEYATWIKVSEIPVSGATLHEVK